MFPMSFNYCQCPNLNLRQLSESESDTLGIHQNSCKYCKLYIIILNFRELSHTEESQFDIKHTYQPMHPHP